MEWKDKMKFKFVSPLVARMKGGLMTTVGFPLLENTVYVIDIFENIIVGAFVVASSVRFVDFDIFWHCMV